MLKFTPEICRRIYKRQQIKHYWQLGPLYLKEWKIRGIVEWLEGLPRISI